MRVLSHKRWGEGEGGGTRERWRRGEEKEEGVDGRGKRGRGGNREGGGPRGKEE